MTLYELEWGLYPRRVGIYLAEKGITGIERIAFDALAATLVRSSIAILEYLEERFPSPDMLGATPEARARTRELVGVIDEAAMQFGIWCHKASPCLRSANGRAAKRPRLPLTPIMRGCGCSTR
ncbi:hypothetical protein LK533_08275 [Sphingomonas sp. PL-96]|uniref:hypothetical protein n=1 Tax=Sphingomonas sp. PL-96 TaxID=2887201 RepID=UPI001E61BF00|nr:hypothetical protein [Sphingomonas sp. PL-96]MCC2976670.1 hypothetical protein [Sphingomonas sp. PL-96]